MSEIPNSIEAEKAVLGAMLIDAIKPYDTDLTAEDFYLNPHRQIFSAIMELTKDGASVSPIILSDFLLSRSASAPDELFSVYALGQLTFGIPYGTNFSREIKLLKEKTMRRRLMQLGFSLQSQAMDSDATNADLIAQTTELLDTLRETKIKNSDGFRSLAEIAGEAVDKYREMANGVSFNIPTGFEEIDRVTRGGIAVGDVWIIGAFTGQGKSALALNMAKNQAELGYSVGAVSREMLDFENFERLHSNLSQTPLWLIKPQMDGAVLDHLERTLPRVANLPIFINSSTGNIYELRRQIKRLVDKQGVKIVFVDYLQLLEAAGEKSNWSRTNEIEKCSRMLKSMAMDFQIGIVALAQYNRLASYSGKAENHSFDGSSAIEKDASVVLHLELEKVEAGADIPKWRKATVRMGKGRQSPQIETNLWFRGECFTFSDKDVADLTLAKPNALNEYSVDDNYH